MTVDSRILPCHWFGAAFAVKWVGGNGTERVLYFKTEDDARAWIKETEELLRAVAAALKIADAINPRFTVTRPEGGAIGA